MTRTAQRASEQFPWKTIGKKVPYEGCTHQSDRAGKTRTVLLEMRMAPAKTMRNNFVAKKCFLENEWKANIPTASSIIPVSFRMPKCCNYLLTVKKESHYSQNEAILPRTASFHQRISVLSFSLFSLIQPCFFLTRKVVKIISRKPEWSEGVYFDFLPFLLSEFL